MSGSSIALDTNQAIAILNDVPAAVAFYGAFAELCLPVTVLGELRYGTLNSGKVNQNLERIDRLAGRCKLLGVGDVTATWYAKLRLALKRIARPIPENDLWIAATCAEHDLPLATADGHFTVVAGFRVVPPPSP
jgi:predicted nucleic acid-binding protein